MPMIPPVIHRPPGSLLLETLQWIVALTALGCVAWLPHTPALFMALCAGTHIEFYEADLNRDDYVSVTEASYACNVDSRPVRNAGRSCTEYYNRVDWRPVKLECTVVR
jgi:hypothetical protein